MLQWGSGSSSDIPPPGRPAAAGRFRPTPPACRCKGRVRDPALRACSLPTISRCASGRVVSGTHLMAIQAPNAELIQDAIAEVTPTASVPPTAPTVTPTSSCWPPGFPRAQLHAAREDRPGTASHRRRVGRTLRHRMTAIGLSQPCSPCWAQLPHRFDLTAVLRGVDRPSIAQ